MSPTQKTNNHFVSTEWLAAHLSDANVSILDASWYLPTMNRDAKAEYEIGHIPGAVFFDIDGVADHTTNLPHMLPKPNDFADTIGRMGLSDTDHIVIYDGSGLFSAPRVWWTFKVMGAKHVSILEGGAPKWQAESHPWTHEVPVKPVKTFTPSFNSKNIATLETVKVALDTHQTQIVDARPASRFRGEAPEPRPGLAQGHMPGSFNVQFGDIVANGSLKTPEEMRQAFQRGGVDLDKPVITSCGSGVSAAILALALDSLGHPIEALYDGSWAEWGSRADCAVVKD